MDTTIFESEQGSEALRRALAYLEAIEPRWAVAVGVPSGGGWVSGEELTIPDEGPLAAVLATIAARMQTEDRKVVALSFALRYGWSSAVAIAPCLASYCVPDIGLANVSLRFGESALFERVSLHAARGFYQPAEPARALEVLRAVLVAQARPVVDALHAWSRLACKVLWGQVVSSWGAQFEPVLAKLGRVEQAKPLAELFFDAPGAAFAARPRFYEVAHCAVTRLYHTRSSCCLYYQTGAGSYCVSCPLIRDDERIARNKAWIERLQASGA